jgi:hypothetical protein
MRSKTFDEDDGSFFVLVNDEERHSMRPTFADVPASCQVVCGEVPAVRRRTKSNRTGPAFGRRVCATGAAWAAPVVDLLFRLSPGRVVAPGSRMAEDHRDG